MNRRLAMALPSIVALSTAIPHLAGGARSPAAVAAHVAFGFSFLPMSMLAASRRPAALLCVAAGAWLLISPWALGYGAITAAAAADAVLGAALVAVSLATVRSEAVPGG
jgi:hypothetical protein